MSGVRWGIRPVRIERRPWPLLVALLAERPDGVSVLAILPPPALPIEAHSADPLALVKRFLGGVDEHRPASVS